MSELDRLTAAQLQDAAQVLGDWIGEERHRAEVDAEMLDADGALACREAADRVRAVQKALEAEATRRESRQTDGEATNKR
ncbi:MAG TPA: hypothetical protein VFD73_08135 [Gemmatimonadales bacterium]|nr:hypothetical protein [Gemmatimonadales bacterium]